MCVCERERESARGIKIKAEMKESKSDRSRLFGRLLRTSPFYSQWGHCVRVLFFDLKACLRT